MHDKSKIYIDIHEHRIKVAMTTNEELCEFHYENVDNKRNVGSIYKGKVVNVLSGLNACFVDIGLEKNAYLSFDESETSTLNSEIKPGDEVMVQVSKDQTRSKGARVTRSISIVGRYLIYRPFTEYVGISRKIECEQTREKLDEMVKTLIEKNPGGFVIRTASANASLKAIKKDAKFLIDGYKKVSKKYEDASCPSLVVKDENIVNRTLRDILNEHVQAIIVNDKECYDNLTNALTLMNTGDKTKIILSEKGDLFTNHGLDKKVKTLFDRKIELSNGSSIVIDSAEALTAIDVNTGKYVGSDNIEETVLKTNMLAAKEIARQIRLRNISGIIIADFIDMKNAEHNEMVKKELADMLKKDRQRTNILDMTELGLIQITRKKTSNDIAQKVMTTCPYCDGSGRILSFDYVLMNICEKLTDTLIRANQGCLITVGLELYPKIFNSKTLESVCKTQPEKRVYVNLEESFQVDKFIIQGLYGSVISVPDGSKLLH